MADPLEGLDSSFAKRLRALLAAAGGRVTVVSGYRSVQQQQALWDAAVRRYGSEAEARKWVAPPGKSNHNHGTAVDLGGDLELAAQLAEQFGLHRPMSWEPWHFEPHGSHEHADPEAYTTPPEDIAAPTGPDRHDLGYQIMNFMAAVTGSTDEPEEVLV